MRILMVVNPASGGKEKKSFILQAQTLARSRGIDIRIISAPRDPEPAKLKDQIEGYKPGKVIAVGGDGTVLFTALALKGTGIPLGIVPMGTSNGLATDLGIPQDEMEAFRQILDGDHSIPLDLIRVNQKYFMVHLGDVGANASFLERNSKHDDWGMLSYGKNFLDEYRQMEPFEYTIKTDKQLMESLKW